MMFELSQFHIVQLFPAEMQNVKSPNNNKNVVIPTKFSVKSIMHDHQSFDSPHSTLTENDKHDNIPFS